MSDEVLARLKPFGISFEKSLNDLIKGIRSNGANPEKLSSFLDRSIVECKNELRTNDLEIKAMSILKLAYLEMYGFDMSWCNFQILEIMASPKFQQKRIGYLACIQSFKNDNDVLILVTNQFKKDLNSHNHLDIGLALSGIGTIVTSNLARDINDDVLKKLNHIKPYIRKKAVLTMYKIFLTYPDSLKTNFPRIVDKLNDEDGSVLSSTISVIVELSKKSPNLFVNNLPQFFSIMESSNNNWLLIRLLKLFQTLSKVEPRLKNKILPSILDLMTKTKASSLIYECVNCIINGEMLLSNDHKDQRIAQLCINELMEFFNKNDANLKFVGLLALIKIIKVFPSIISTNSKINEIIINCLNDDDIIIKSQVLSIVELIITETNIADIIKILLLQLIPSEDDEIITDAYKSTICSKIVSISKQSNYSIIPNFKWYIAVLNDLLNLTCLSNSIDSTVSQNIAKDIGNEFKNIAVRIPSMRDVILEESLKLLNNPQIYDNCDGLVKDLYWVIGEFNKEDISAAAREAFFDKIVDIKSDLGKKVITLNGDVLTVLIQSMVKLLNGVINFSDYSYSGRDLSPEEVKTIGLIVYKLVKFLTKFENNMNFEVQERAVSWLEFLKICVDALGLDLGECQRLFEESEKVIEEEEEDDDDEEESEESEESDDENLIDVNNSRDEYDNFESEEDEVYSDPELSKNPFSEEGNAEEPNEHIADITDPLIETVVPTEETPIKVKHLPVLLSVVLPSFFDSYDLNPIAINSQRKIMVPDDLNLNEDINEPLVVEDFSSDESDTSIEELYEFQSSEYQPESLAVDEVNDEKKKLRLERLRDDPFYLNDDKPSIRSHTTLNSADSESVFSKLNSEIEPTPAVSSKKSKKSSTKASSSKPKRERVVILSEETLEGEEVVPIKTPIATNKQKNILKIDSSNLDNFNFNDSTLTETDKDYEYEIDLDQIRARLAQTVLQEEERKPKKKKSKSGEEGSEKKKKKKSSTKKAAGTNDIASEEPLSLIGSLAATQTVAETDSTETKDVKKSKKKSEGDVIEVKKNKKIKKKKAVIED